LKSEGTRSKKNEKINGQEPRRTTAGQEDGRYRFHLEHEKDLRKRCRK